MDYSQIPMLWKERKLLFRMQYLHYYPDPKVIEAHSRLIKLKFIAPFPENVNNQNILVYKVTNEYRLYQSWRREQAIHRYFTPIVISITTTLATLIVKELLAPMLPSELADIVRGLI